MNKYDWMNVKEIVLPRVGIAKHIENIEEFPHRIIGDTALFFYIPEIGKTELKSVINIDSEVFKGWGITSDELFDAAMRNAKSDARLINLEDMVSALWTDSDSPDSGDDLFAIEGKLEVSEGMPLVLTNTERFLGASVIFNNEAQEKLYEVVGGKYYVLPSSIHEVLVMPTSDRDPLELIHMVREINRAEVRPEEWMSDGIFEYTSDGLKFHSVGMLSDNIGGLL